MMLESIYMYGDLNSDETPYEKAIIDASVVIWMAMLDLDPDSTEYKSLANILNQIGELPT